MILRVQACFQGVGILKGYARPDAVLTDSEERILSGMSSQPRTAERIARRIGRSCTSGFREQLRMLELREVIRHRHGTYWIQS